MMQKPMLSIGIIFKNEIRCLERCLQSLRPLREAIPCELVMADTGSDDGSRKIAEEYADILIDFPWVDDFAAARNAVMDRCSGKWYFSIDCDEWLDKDIAGLVQFFSHEQKFNFGSVIIRNYASEDLEQSGNYSDFMGVRLLRMSTGLRYKGAIHERWDTSGGLQAVLVDRLILHHDGYVSSGGRWSEKQIRNMPMLRKKLADNPEDLTTLTQCIESGRNIPGFMEYLHRAVDGVKEKWTGWDFFGPPILRSAVQAAATGKLPELDEWIALAEELFPQNLFIRIDVAYYAFGIAWERDNYAEAIRRGEGYLRAIADYRSGHYNYTDLLTSCLCLASPYFEMNVAIVLASAYLKTYQPGECFRVLRGMDGGQMDDKQVTDWLQTLCELHAKSDENTAPVLLHFWEQALCPRGEKFKKQRYLSVLRLVSRMFALDYRNEEILLNDIHRHAYTLFLPLLKEKDCELGTAAAILETADQTELEKLLRTVEKWEGFPIYALEHALLEGVQFPLPGKSLKIEEMDALAARMARKDGAVTGLALLAADRNFSENWQTLAWTRGLVLAAVRACDWTEEAQGMELCRAFAKIENAFLAQYYVTELLCDENIQVLPPMHRFGWYCSKAFRALDAGDTAAYVRLLRQGLESCTEMKPMVEFLLKKLEEDRRAHAAPELLALAEQVRAVLSAYPADDPAVLALKQSEAYQKVAQLIEGPDLGVFGGLPQ